MNTAAKEAIQELVNWLSWNTELTKDTPLFPSQIGDGRLSRFQAHRILKLIYDAGLTGKVTTHSLRKSFGTKIYTVSKDIMVTRELLGHANVNTTQKYIGVGKGTGGVLPSSLSALGKPEKRIPTEGVL